MSPETWDHILQNVFANIPTKITSIYVLSWNKLFTRPPTIDHLLLNILIETQLNWTAGYSTGTIGPERDVMKWVKFIGSQSGLTGPLPSQWHFSCAGAIVNWERSGSSFQ